MLRLILLLSAIASPLGVTGCCEVEPEYVCDPAACSKSAKEVPWAELGDCNPPDLPDLLKNGVSYVGYRWTNNRLPFIISGSFDSSQVSMIRTAAANINRNTGGCITLEEVSSVPGGNYVDVINDDSGCYAWLGMLGIGRQKLNLANGCFVIGTVEHEFLHALGVHHEHKRPDRDEFVEILEGNIEDNAQSLAQFTKNDPSEVLNYGPYDYGSVMHYPDWAFQASAGLKTIRGKNCDCFGQRNGMSAADTDKLKNMYNCP